MVKAPVEAHLPVLADQLSHLTPASRQVPPISPSLLLRGSSGHDLHVTRKPDSTIAWHAAGQSHQEPHPAKGIFWGRPQSFLADTSLPSFAARARESAAGWPLTVLRLSSATYRRCWLISAGSSEGIPISAQSELDSVSFAAGLHKNIRSALQGACKGSDKDVEHP